MTTCTHKSCTQPSYGDSIRGLCRGHHDEFQAELRRVYLEKNQERKQAEKAVCVALAKVLYDANAIGGASAFCHQQGVYGQVERALRMAIGEYLGEHADHSQDAIVDEMLRTGELFGVYVQGGL